MGTCESTPATGTEFKVHLFRSAKPHRPLDPNHKRYPQGQLLILCSVFIGLGLRAAEFRIQESWGSSREFGKCGFAGIGPQVILSGSEDSVRAAF